MIRRFNLDTNKYNWCIIGNSGAGKSTLVNTLRGLKPKDEGAAAVGIVETTHERKAYPMPNYPYATIWDLPGGGTEAHPAATYCTCQPGPGPPTHPRVHASTTPLCAMPTRRSAINVWGWAQ